MDPHESMKEEIYSLCDEEFGAQHRAEAIKLADERVAEFEVDRPRTPAAGLRLMQKVYAEVAAKHKPADEPEPRPAPQTLTPATVARSRDHKPGTLDAVAADMGKRMKAGTWKPGPFDGMP